MKRLALFFIIAAAFLLLSCSGGSSATSPVTAFDFFPLTAGNYWISGTYWGADTLATHSIDSTVVGNSRTFFQTVCYPLTNWRFISGNTWAPGSPNYLYNTTDGLYDYYDTTSSNGAIRSMKFPVAVGDQWNVGSFNTLTCQSVTDSVVVPAGTFKNCVRSLVTNHQNNAYAIAWHKPGLGEIRQVYYNTTGAIDSIRTLRSYHIH